jgi:putative lipoprotein (rSAM/lipoprotein system)
MKKVYKTYNSIIAALLAVLGFSSCMLNSGDEYGTPAVEYGAPYADFVITGNVSSAETNKPIPALKVVMQQEYGVDENGNSLIAPVDSTKTDENGNYQVKNTDGSWSSDYYNIAVLDTDGEENGAFNDTTVAVSFKDATFVDGSGWYKGKATETVNVKLQTKNK